MEHGPMNPNATNIDWLLSRAERWRAGRLVAHDIDISGAKRFNSSGLLHPVEGGATDAMGFVFASGSTVALGWNGTSVAPAYLRTQLTENTIKEGAKQDIKLLVRAGKEGSGTDNTDLALSVTVYITVVDADGALVERATDPFLLELPAVDVFEDFEIDLGTLFKANLWTSMMRPKSIITFQLEPAEAPGTDINLKLLGMQLLYRENINFDGVA